MGRFHQARARRADDGGFTIMETVVTMAIVTAILGIVLGIITNLFQQSENVRDTMTGVQQDQTAGQALTQYLHSTTVILPGSNAATLNASILAGINGSDTPDTATLSAVLTNSASPKRDATFSTTLTPNGGHASVINIYDVVNSVTIANCMTVLNGTGVTGPSGGFPNVVSGMLITGPGIATRTTVMGISGNSLTLSTNATATGTVSLTFGSGGFTYYYDNYSTSPVSLSSTATPGSGGIEYSEIVAIGIDIEFLAGPNVPTEGFQADRPTTFQTTVYLQNSAGAPAPSTTTTPAASGTVAIGQPLSVTATVTANGGQPDGGSVTFSVSLGGSSLSVCTSPVNLNVTTDQATCTFTPASSGAYTIGASYSGTSGFQPSQGSVGVVVPIGTTTTLGVTGSGSGSGSKYSFSITATVGANGGSTPTGSVAFKLTDSSCGSGGCTITVPLTSGIAAWTKSGISNGSYNLTANFSDATGTYASSTASWSGSP
jgi:hypothetical protein